MAGSVYEPGKDGLVRPATPQFPIGGLAGVGYPLSGKAPAFRIRPVLWKRDVSSTRADAAQHRAPGAQL